MSHLIQIRVWVESELSQLRKVRGWVRVESIELSQESSQSENPESSTTLIGTIVFVSSRRIEPYKTSPRKVNFKIWPQVRSRFDLSRSYCTSIDDASGQDKHIGECPMSLSQSYQKLLAKTHIDLMTSSCDLKWPFQRSLTQNCTRVINNA